MTMLSQGVILREAYRHFRSGSVSTKFLSSASLAYQLQECDNHTDKHLECELQERRTKSSQASTSYADATSSHRWQEMQRELRRHDKAGLKTFRSSKEEVRRALKPVSSCSSAVEQAGSPGSSALHWTEALAAVGDYGKVQAGQLLETALTDSFGAVQSAMYVLHAGGRRGLIPSVGSVNISRDFEAEVMDTAEDPQNLQSGLFVKAGVTKIRLTGGEPTLRRDIVSLTAQLNALPGLEKIGITTNGIALKRKLPDLLASGMTLLNISLDTLRQDRFEQMTRRRGLDRVLEAIQTAIDLGFAPVKVNVVVMRGVNDDEICDFVELTRDRPINVRFIEYMPFDGNVWSREKMVSYRDMFRAIQQQFPQGLERWQDPKGEVAKNFSLPASKGSVSFITSMTQAFCSECNRLRLMADGNLKVCLFGANEVSLRDAMREGATDQDLLAIISAAVNRKKAAHAGMFELSRSKNRAMVHIGG